MTTTEPNTDVDAFLTGGGGKSASFKDIGDKVVGKVVSKRMAQQTDLDGKPKFWDDGKPMEQAIVTLQTDDRDPDDADDEGLRNVYLKGSLREPTSAAGSVAKALRDAKAKRLEIGGELAMQFTGLGTAKKAGLSAPKQYVAAYKPPVANPTAASAEDLFGD